MMQYLDAVSIQGVDVSEKRRQEATDMFNITTFATLEEAMQTFCDCAFVCTAPLSHNNIISECLEAGMHVFSELNLVCDGYLENMRLAKKAQKTLYISSTLLYREDIRFLISQIQQYASPLSYTYHVGQYLPDWHPWEKYSDYFVSEKRTGGCRELFTVELPWLLRAFGDIANISVTRYKMSSLELQYPDTYYVLIEHKSGTVGQMMVDVVTRVPVRHFEVFGETLQLEWRGKPEEVWTARPDYSAMQRVDIFGTPLRQADYHDFIVEDAYYEEIREFFCTIEGKFRPSYTFEDDLRTLQIVDQILGAGY